MTWPLWNRPHFKCKKLTFTLSLGYRCGMLYLVLLRLGCILEYWARLYGADYLYQGVSTKLTQVWKWFTRADHKHDGLMCMRRPRLWRQVLMDTTARSGANPVCLVLRIKCLNIWPGLSPAGAVSPKENKKKWNFVPIFPISPSYCVQAFMNIHVLEYTCINLTFLFLCTLVINGMLASSWVRNLYTPRAQSNIFCAFWHQQQVKIQRVVLAYFLGVGTILVLNVNQNLLHFYRTRKDLVWAIR